MFGNGVSLRDYEGVSGFGIDTQQRLDDLNKALSAGTQRPPTSGGNVLRPESLEATLRIITSSLKNVKFWPKIPKLPAFSTVEEYNLLTAYGENAGAFTNEGDLPEAQDSTYLRKTALIKFLGVTGEVTHPMTLVRPAHGNVTALETQNKVTWLIQMLEHALYFGRSDVITQEFDGIIKQILDGAGLTDPWNNDPVQASNPAVVDARGGGISEDMIETTANLIVENYGTPTDLHMAPRANSDLAKLFYPRERVNLPLPQEGKVGFAVNSFMSSAGLIEFSQNVFMRSAAAMSGRKEAPAAATSPKAPNPPSNVTGSGSSDAASKFVAGNNGTYIYKVTAINRFGESAAFTTAGISVAVGDKVTLTIVDGGGANPATGYRVYRTKVGGAAATAQILTQGGIPRDAVTPADTAFVDFNFWLPGTTVAVMLQQNLQCLSFRQLAPMMKIPLATIAASIRWMMLLYGTPIVYAPYKAKLIINVRDA